MKKNCKIIQSVISVMLSASFIAGAFSGCGKDIAEDEVAQTSPTSGTTHQTDISTSSESETTSEEASDSSKPVTAPVSSTTKVTRNSKFLKAEKSSVNDMRYLLCYLFEGTGLIESKADYSKLKKEIYNCESKDAVKQAMKLIEGQFCNSVFEYELLPAYYNKMEKFFKDDGKEPRDPLGKFDDIWQYKRIKADIYDKCLKTMFNVSPDHNIVLIDEFGGTPNYVTTYYHDGYYYLPHADGGNACDSDIDIESYTMLDDGKYLFKATLMETEDLADENFFKVGSFNITAALIKSDGGYMWSIYKIEKA